MKPILAVFLCALCMLISGTAFAQQANNPKNFELVIKATQTEQEIKDIQQDLKRRLITLEIEELKYNVFGRIKILKGSITFNDGATGQFHSENFRQLKILRQYNNSGRAGNISITIK
ncbi:MAG: hypothetical protein H6585_04625 [Flavobacteriales bacterium]|nr:hypothetical protein [Flavobacteriales bacterium]MCB9447612.1 hypothetical protein [Flavobacteriales bacterium]